MYYVSDKIRLGISCESSASESSHEMPSLIFSVKERIMNVLELCLTLIDLHFEKTDHWTCVPSEDLDQSAHSHRLIKIFTARIEDSQGSNFFLPTTKTDQTVQTDFSLCWGHMSEGMFSYLTAQLLWKGSFRF